ncbi:MAG: hypothetical protein K2N34_12760 [Lachnospiraceae bacterium]|nr:hypothetical protein [Lachnospiraceae bacterium]
MSSITRGLEEFDYLTPTIRELLKHRNTTCAEDDSFFFRMVPVEKRVAYYNNYEAYKFAIGSAPELYNRMLNSKVISTIHKKLLAKITNYVSIEGEEDNNVTLIKNSIVAFPKKIKQAVSASMLRGEAVISITLDDEDVQDPKVILNVYPLARYDLITNQADEIIEATLYKQLMDGETKYIKYVLAEHRYKRGDSYYAETIVTRYESTKLSDFAEDMKCTKLDEKDLPPSIVKVLDGIKINSPHSINGIGVYKLSNTYDNSLCPNSDVGESQYLDAIDVVLTHETSYTFKEIDKNIGRGRVLTPSIGRDLDRSITTRINYDGSISRRVVNTFLDHTFITPYENYQVDKATPQGIQFALRTQEWLMDKNDALSEICTKCGLSVYDYNPTLFNGVRTAREIDELSDLTKSTVTEKHSMYDEVLNTMLKDIANLLNKGETSLFIKWDKSTTENAAANNEIVLARYGAGLCSRETAIKNLNPNWNDKEVEAELSRIDNETDNRNATTVFEAI